MLHGARILIIFTYPLIDVICSVYDKEVGCAYGPYYTGICDRFYCAPPASAFAELHLLRISVSIFVIDLKKSTATKNDGYVIT